MRKEYRPISELVSLSDKRAIVTGGATGIGFAIAYRLAEAGATVTIVDLNSEKGERACQELKGCGYQVTFIPGDVSREKEVKDASNIAVRRMGGIDILVNNAGIYPSMPLTQMTEDDFERVMAVNLKGTFLFSREGSQRMMGQRRGGCIINIASIDAVHPSFPGLSAYGASKGGVLMFTKSLALELGQYNIRVNAIAPGGILTESTLSRGIGASSKEMRAQLKGFMARLPLGRMGKADDIARVALFLASDLASYITGSLIVVDGGYLVS